MGLSDIIMKLLPPIFLTEGKQSSDISSVTALIRNFPFQIAGKQYSGIVDTGASDGVVINYADFLKFVTENEIRRVRPAEMYVQSGSRLKGYVRGRGEIGFKDNQGNTWVFKDMPISSFPLFRRDLTHLGILGNAFIARLYEAEFYSAEPNSQKDRYYNGTDFYFKGMLRQTRLNIKA